MANTALEPVKNRQTKLTIPLAVCSDQLWLSEVAADGLGGACGGVRCATCGMECSDGLA